MSLLHIATYFLIMFTRYYSPFITHFSASHPAFLRKYTLKDTMHYYIPLFIVVAKILLFPMQGNVDRFCGGQVNHVIIPLVF